MLFPMRPLSCLRPAGFRDQNPHDPFGIRRTSLLNAFPLTLPRLSCTVSETAILNHCVPSGNGGGGISAQLIAGIVRIALVVVWLTVVAAPNVQSHCVMVPGAVDVLPLNVQFSVVPLFASVHVSVSVGPVTPKRAVATVGGVTCTAAVADVPP
jgi:hypothetical protein